MTFSEVNDFIKSLKLWLFRIPNLDIDTESPFYYGLRFNNYCVCKELLDEFYVLMENMIKITLECLLSSDLVSIKHLKTFFSSVSQKIQDVCNQMNKFCENIDDEYFEIVDQCEAILCRNKQKT